MRRHRQRRSNNQRCQIGLLPPRRKKTDRGATSRSICRRLARRSNSKTSRESLVSNCQANRPAKSRSQTCAALSPELEAELQPALGEEPLDEIIAKETGASTGEILETETRLKGRVLRIFRDNVFVDLGGRNQGVLMLHTLRQGAGGRRGCWM